MPESQQEQLKSNITIINTKPLEDATHQVEAKLEGIDPRKVITGTDIDGVLTDNNIPAHLLGFIDPKRFSILKEFFDRFVNSPFCFVLTSRPESILWQLGHAWKNSVHDLLTDKMAVSRIVDLPEIFDPNKFLGPRVLIASAGKDFVARIARFPT